MRHFKSRVYAFGRFWLTRSNLITRFKFILEQIWRAKFVSAFTWPQADVIINFVVVLIAQLADTQLPVSRRKSETDNNNAPLESKIVRHILQSCARM